MPWPLRTCGITGYCTITILSFYKNTPASNRNTYAGKLAGGLAASNLVNKPLAGIGMMPRCEAGLVIAAIDDAKFSAILILMIACLIAHFF